MTPLVSLYLHALVFAHSRAGRCPNCASGEEVRAAVFADGFLLRLGTLSLPFLVLAAVCYAVARRRP